jgi:hypothetical protein
VCCSRSHGSEKTLRGEDDGNGEKKEEQALVAGRIKDENGRCYIVEEPDVVKSGF